VLAVPKTKRNGPVPKAASTPCPSRLGKPAWSLKDAPRCRSDLPRSTLSNASQTARIDRDGSVTPGFVMPEPAGGRACERVGPRRVGAPTIRCRHPQPSRQLSSAVRSYRWPPARISRDVTHHVDAEPKCWRLLCLKDGLATVGGTAPENPNERMCWFSPAARGPRQAAGALGSGSWVRLFSRSCPFLISS
jgi:hypothetical protein